MKKYKGMNEEREHGDDARVMDGSRTRREEKIETKRKVGGGKATLAKIVHFFHDTNDSRLLTYQNTHL